MGERRYLLICESDSSPVLGEDPTQFQSMRTWYLQRYADIGVVVWFDKLRTHCDMSAFDVDLYMLILISCSSCEVNCYFSFLLNLIYVKFHEFIYYSVLMVSCMWGIRFQIPLHSQGSSLICKINDYFSTFCWLCNRLNTVILIWID